ncbi:MAG: hypothetical protein SFU99_23130 [Saprospiraceae bacterium]|nr:hypothetical protein [Saprospiraceae bacterium]
MEWLGLLFEVLFLALGIYLYLLAIGKITSPDPNARKNMEAWRTRNGRWVRLAALALTAIMFVNIFLHLQELLK